VHGDRQAALQYLLLDPVVSDIEVAQQILDDYWKPTGSTCRLFGRINSLILNAG